MSYKFQIREERVIFVEVEADDYNTAKEMCRESYASQHITCEDKHYTDHQLYELDSDEPVDYIIHADGSIEVDPPTE